MNVWYVSYGSNLYRDRFMCYIQGGQPEGSEKVEKGCRDQTPPKADEKIELRYPLYFAKNRSKWGKGGVAFIDHQENPDVKTIGRMYLITNEQFEDVVAQENNEENLTIPLEKVIDNGFHNINENWYGRIVFLGYKEGAPMFTFTNPVSMNGETFFTPPSSYVKIISKGLEELGMSRNDIVHYFKQCGGIKDSFTKEQLYRYIYREQGKQ
ncbi:hypothetical protein [Heyndrickxia camelliae]|uniref:Histone deacetylase n=1 Tax=Heyndrickxia camelliae TaxID=1707093 RepID=A0A2N3LLT2_9BACI|nr:hypothetical protein [Heyndrickxia camelliae]PKR85581.1 hypothetical protein CWO92_07685 [Heyndrickxia camelliae]